MFPAPRTSPALVFPRRPQHGEVLPLKTVTYAAVAVSLAALLAASALLALVRTLRSNLHSTHRHLAGALFCSQLVFVVGVAQTGNPVSPPRSLSPNPALRLCPRPAGGPSPEAGVAGAALWGPVGSVSRGLSLRGCLWEPRQKGRGLQSRCLSRS